jgi:hypothetical protein
MSAPTSKMQTVKIVGAVLVTAFAVVSAGCAKQPVTPLPPAPIQTETPQ